MYLETVCWVNGRALTSLDCDILEEQKILHNEFTYENLRPEKGIDSMQDFLIL